MAGKLFSFVIALAMLGSSALGAHAAGEPVRGPLHGSPPTVGTQTKNLPPANYDVRAQNPVALSAVVKQHATRGLQDLAGQARAQASAARAGLARLQAAAPGAVAVFSPLTGAVEVVRDGGGALTATAPGRPGREIVLDFLRANQALYGLSAAEIDGLVYLGESVSPASGLRMVRFEQQVNGLPVFQSDTRFILDRGGRMVATLGLLIPAATATAAPVADLISPEQALQSAMRAAGLTLDAARMSSATTESAARQTTVAANDAQLPDPVSSRLVYFAAAPGILIPAWAQVAFTTGAADWYTLVDAQTGAPLWRKNIRSDAAPAGQVTGSAATPKLPMAKAAPAPDAGNLAAPGAAVTSTEEARFSVYAQADGKTPADSPAPHSPTDVVPGSGTQFPAIARTVISMSAVQDPVASPAGWIPDGGTTTTGNNVDAYLDVSDLNQPNPGLLDNNGRPVGNPDGAARNRDFLGTGYAYTPPPTSGNPDAGTNPGDPQFQRGIVTHLFYLVNWYHDQLHRLGFDEAAGNFQNDNFGRGGAGSDPVLAEAQDGSGTNNANFSTPPDGQAGRMQMYIFDYPTPNRDGSLDAEVVLHELTHGLSNRLIGDGEGLIWDEGGGMGEGWSDFYALSLLNGSNADDPDGRYASGAYATYGLGGLTDNYLYGIRRFPYSTDHTVNPLTWADVDDVTYDETGGIPSSPLGFGYNGALEVHNAGEIWALTLWGVRSRVIADPAGAHGDVPTGNHTMLQLATDALKLTPLNPSFTDARDALLDADCATQACANEASIWAGFADRGLGYKAVAPLGQAGAQGIAGHVGVGTSFAVPYLDVKDVTVDDSLGNGNGAIDPGETIKLKVNLQNPWRNAARGIVSATATLSTATPGVSLLVNQASYGAIAANGSASGTPFTVRLDSAAACGQALKFTLHTSSALGGSSSDVVLRVGTPAGIGAPKTYTHVIQGGLAIPDNDLAGMTDSLAIGDDDEIADLNFRVDSLAHTFTGDLAVMLKAPNGYGTDLIYYRGAFIGQGSGANFTNTVIDDQSANDLNLTGSGDAPYTGEWQTAFNSSIWNMFGNPGVFSDPVGQLSRVNGLSTQGTWQVHITDAAMLDVGKLNSWSLIVTPRAYTCSSFVPADLTMQKSATPNVVMAGRALTYTLAFGNAGGARARGVVITDVVPGALTAVNVVSSGVTITDTGAAPHFVWAVSDLEPNASGLITITGIVDLSLRPAATLTNTARISTNSIETNTANDVATVTTQVQIYCVVYLPALAKRR